MLAIEPERLYDAAELKELLGMRTIERLRAHGLIAFAGRYLGRLVLDSWVAAAQAEFQCRRGLQGGKNEETTKANRVEEDCSHRIIQRVPKPRPGVSVADQLERSRRSLV